MRTDVIKKLWLGLSLGLSLWVGAAWVGAPVLAQDDSTAAVAPSITWMHSFDQARRVAAQKSRYVLVEFYTDWCEKCQAMAESTYVDTAIIALEKRMVFVRVNADNDTATARLFRVKRYPTLILANSDGNEVDRVVGYLSAPELRSILYNYLEGTGTLGDLQRQLRENPKKITAVFAIAEKFELRGDPAQAKTRYEKVLKLDARNGSGFTDDAHFALARLLRNDGKWYKAIEGFRRMIEAFPESELREDADIYIPWLYVRAGDTTAAIKYYEQFLDEHGGSSEKDWVKGQIAKLETTPGADGSPEPGDGDR